MIEVMKALVLITFFVTFFRYITLFYGVILIHL